jgi:outer membrane protein OmpA-like peptidoglycan-associated protein
MMVRKFGVFLTLSFFVLLALVPAKADAERFEFRHVQGARYRILSRVDQTVFINNVLSHRAEILNRVAVEVTNVQDGRGLHRAVFQTSERLIYDSLDRAQQAATTYQWSREYESVFERDSLGNLTIDPQYFMPVVRNVPVFPDRNLRIGDRWHAPAYEVHDFRDAFGIREPYRIDFNAFYEYVGDRQWKGVVYPAFSVNYNIESRPQPVVGRIFPVRISGTFNQLVYWDRALGQAVAYNETYHITFTMSDGRTIQFRGTAEAEFVESEIMDRDRIVSEIIDEINRLAIPDVNVRAVEEGISISLEDIRFIANTDRMVPGEEAKLERIAEILMRYPNRDILISGHTALAGTAEERLRLSQDRARAVANYFLSRNVRAADRMVVRGFGADMPIADNATEEGMRRNRRVEITILEN